MLTLLEAANQTGKTKPAILKAIRRGRVSATKDAQGRWQVDPAELFRVYPRVSPDGEPEVSHDDSGLTVDVAVLEERCRQLQAQLTDVKAERDAWRQQATALLADQRQAVAPARRWSWWPWARERR